MVRQRRAAALPFAGFVLLTTLAVRPAHADTPRDAVAAEALFRAGREAFKKGDFATACNDFAESQRLDAAAGTALNLSECDERLGRTASAWKDLREAMDLLPPNDDRLPAARERLPRLEARLPKLVIRLAASAPKDAKVFRDDVELGPSLLGFAQPVDPGEHVLRVHAPGHKDRTFRASVAEREIREVEATAGEAEAAPPSPSPPVARGWRKTGVLLLAVGAAGLGTSTVTTVLMLGKSDDRAKLCATGCDLGTSERSKALSLNDEGRTLSAVSTVAFAVGVAAVAAGAYLLLTSKTTRPARAAPTALTF
jgi:hypothetical protein